MDFISTLFENYDIWILVVVVFIAQLGIPVGSSFFLMWYGSTLETSTTLLMIVPITTAAAVLGDMSAYSIGRLFSQQLIHAEEKYNWLAKKTKNSRKLIQEHGKWIVCTTRFIITGMGPMISYLLGGKKYPVNTFFIWVLIGETLFCLELLYFGYRFKETWEDLLNFISDIGWLIALVIIAIWLLNKLLIKEKVVVTNKLKK